MTWKRRRRIWEDEEKVAHRLVDPAYIEVCHRERLVSYQIADQIRARAGLG